MIPDIIWVLYAFVVFVLICLIPSVNIPARVEIWYRLWRLKHWIKKNPDGTTYDKKCYELVKKLYYSIFYSTLSMTKYSFIRFNLEFMVNKGEIHLNVKVSFLKKMISEPLTFEEIKKNNISVSLGKNEYAG